MQYQLLKHDLIFHGKNTIWVCVHSNCFFFSNGVNQERRVGDLNFPSSYSNAIKLTIKDPWFFWICRAERGREGERVREREGDM